MSSNDSSSIDALFKEHSFEEIESVRDNLANEIEKRTEILKSIVKEKYHDIVQTSDAIQAMKLNLRKIESSFQTLDCQILEFHQKIGVSKDGGSITKRHSSVVDSSAGPRVDDTTSEVDPNATLINRLVSSFADMWEQFDLGNFKRSVRLLHDSTCLLDAYHQSGDKGGEKHRQLVENLDLNLKRAKDVMKNQLWNKVHSAEPNQVGIIDSGIEVDEDQERLFQLCVESCIGHLIEKLQSDITDTSYYAQIRRYQPFAYFNTKDNQIEQQVDDFRPPATVGCHVQIPKDISVELSLFLYEVCRVINTISGFSLSKLSVIHSLEITVEKILQVYAGLLPKLEIEYKGESKRRRAMQLYFDLLYVRVLLNTSKDIELIEKMDPMVSQLASKFELMLDSIELYMASDAMHTNVVQLSQSTIRLYGLLIPNLP